MNIFSASRETFAIIYVAHKGVFLAMNSTFCVGPDNVYNSEVPSSVVDATKTRGPEGGTGLVEWVGDVIGKAI